MTTTPKLMLPDRSKMIDVTPDVRQGFDFSGGAPEAKPAPTMIVGGSDIGAILGHDPYRNDADVWLRLLGFIDRDVTDTSDPSSPEWEPEATEVGRMFEDAIIAEWARRHKPAEVIRGPTIHETPYIAPDGWRAVRPDAIAIMPDGKRIGVEAKITWAFDSDWGQPGTDFCPKQYRCQGAWYLDVMERRGEPLERVDVVAFSTGKRVYREYPLRPGKAVAAISAYVEEWMERHVWSNPPVPPSLPSVENMRRMFPEHADIADRKVWLEPDAEDLDIGQRLARIAFTRKVLDSKFERHMTTLVAKIGPNYGIRDVADWRNMAGHRVLDFKRLEREHPALYAQLVANEIIYMTPATRAFNVRAALSPNDPLVKKETQTP